MSGQLLEFAAGKIPQRALRYLDQLPYFVTYQSKAVIDFGDTGDNVFALIITPANRRGKVMQVDVYNNGETFAGTTDKAYVAIGTTDAGQEVAYTGDIADGTAPASFSAAAGTLIDGVAPIMDPADLIYMCGMDGEGTPTGQAWVDITVLYFE